MTRLGALVVVVVGLVASLAACGGESGNGDVADSGGAGGPDGGGGGGADAGAGASDGGATDPLVQDRPYGLFVPSGYDDATPTPLIVVLHGYTATGAIQLAYFGLEAVAEERTILVAYPDGLVDGAGNHYWNASDACCDLGG